MKSTDRSLARSTQAVFADFFSVEDSPAAFANIIVQSGIASTFAFFAFPNFGPTTKQLLLLVTSASGFGCYFVAHGLHVREKAAAENKAYSELENDENPAEGDPDFI